MKISYRMIFRRLRSSKACRRKPIRFYTGPLSGKTLYMSAPSSTLTFTMRRNGQVYHGYYDAQGTWIGESSYQIV